MAKKIPVGATIAHAYRFAFGDYRDLLKLTWPLMAVMVLSNVWLGSRMAALPQGLPTHGFPAMTMFGPLLILLYVAIMLVTVMWITGIYQYALGRPETRQRTVYFSLAKPMWRLIGASLLMILSLLGILLAYVIAISIILYCFRLGLGAAHISDNALKGITIFDVSLAFLVGYCGLIFCAFRFGFLLFVVTLEDDRIGLFKSWTLSHGNFWRMFVIGLAIFVPFMILEILAFYWLGLFPHFHPGITPAEIQASQGAAFARMLRYWYIIYPVGVLVTLLLYALMAAAQVFAYRALTQDGA